jgi:predicted MPP superfamily phosphohydrolase
MRKPFNKRRIVLRIVAYSIAASLAAWVFLIEPNRLIIHEETLLLPNSAALNNLRIAVLSDLHVGGLFVGAGKLQRVVAMTNASDPDLILILGDFMVTGKLYQPRMEPEAIAENISGLHARFGVYAVLGNHDWWFDGARMRRALEASGIKVLENEVVHIQGAGRSFWLAGLSDLWTRPQNIVGTLQQVPPNEPVIALTHNPDIFPQIPTTVSLTLAGHTHGGQVNFPFFGRPIVPSKFGQRYAAGHITENGKQLFVTTGVGTSILPVRFRVPPEIVVLTLRSEPATRAGA